MDRLAEVGRVVGGVSVWAVVCGWLQRGWQKGEDGRWVFAWRWRAEVLGLVARRGLVEGRGRQLSGERRRLVPRSAGQTDGLGRGGVVALALVR